MSDPNRFAVLDIGSNSVRFLVAEPGNPGFIPLHSAQTITRLGERLHETGNLNDAAMERTFSAIESLIDGAKHLKPMSIYAVATYAARSADNVETLKELFEKKFSFGLDVIDWEREAKLSLKGAAMVIEDSGPILLFDIGGGSTEFIYRNLSGGDIRSVGSSLGVVRLAETFIKKVPLSENEYRPLALYLEEEVLKIKEKLEISTKFSLVGTAGTITSIAAIHYNIESYDPELINNRRITDENVKDILEKVGAMTIQERSRIETLQNGREDLIIPGMAIVLAVMKVFNAGSLTVSDSGLREGLIMSLIDGSIRGSVI